jgi:hypothetical protein
MSRAARRQLEGLRSWPAFAAIVSRSATRRGSRPKMTPRPRRNSLLRRETNSPGQRRLPVISRPSTRIPARRREEMSDAGLGHEFRYRRADRTHKGFPGNLDALRTQRTRHEGSLPAGGDGERRPCRAPRYGSFTEIVRATGGACCGTDSTARMAARALDVYSGVAAARVHA